jgi:PAS domain S-box-containing protein
VRRPGRAGRPRLTLASLQAKLLLGTVLVVFGLMSGVVLVVEQRQHSAIIEEVERRGEVIARSLAATSSGPLLLYNYTTLEQNVARTAVEADVAYAIVLDAEGKVAAHSERAAAIGTALEGEVDARAAAAEDLLIQEVSEEPGNPGVLDFAVPIRVERQRWGVARIGLSKRRMEAEIAATRRELVLLTGATLILGGLAAALVAQRIARPVRALAAGAEAVSRGELGQRIEPAGSDEIAQLAIAFNHMTTRLFQQRAELETAHDELRRRFEELADLKSYTDSILGSLTSGVVTLDLDGRVATLNPAAELLTGLFEPEVRGRYCTEVFAHTAGVSEALMETLANRAGVSNAALVLRRPSGTTVPVELSTAPLRGIEGKELGVVGMFRDLAQVRELEDQVRRSDRLAALGTLAAGLAHEIKNPLTSLRTFTRLLPRKFEDERYRTTFQRVVPRELERINAIVERLLELARPGRLTLERVQVPHLLERVLELYEHQIQSGEVTVVREYARDCPPIQADGEQLYQAFVNLVTNALDAMGPGGRLTLRAGWDEGGTALGPARRGGAPRRLQVEVEDTGAGIGAAEADKVFNPFFTTKSSGTGLGLALTHKIIEDHRGSITFRSTPGVGTTFRVLLPLQAERAGGNADG